MTAIKIDEYKDCIWNLQLLKMVFMDSLSTLDITPCCPPPDPQTKHQSFFRL